MGFLRKKKVNKWSYYYYVEKERKDGKPVDSVHIYLGTADEIMRKINEGSRPKSGITLKTFEYGKLAALLAIDEELGFRKTVDSVVSKRNESGLSVGDYALISIFGRWCGPLSKTATAKNFTDSFIGFGSNIPKKLTAQNIISQMKYFDRPAISEIECGLANNLKQHGIVPNLVVWDTSNNFTFIEKGESIPQKGKSKQGRHNKNLIGVGLAVSEHNLPVFHSTIPGNEHDAPSFNEAVDDIIQRLKGLEIDPQDLVMVFDKGNNSEVNIKKLSGKINVLGSLKKNQVKDLFKIPMSRYETLYWTDKGVEITGFMKTMDLYSKRYNVVISLNPGTKKRQIASYERSKKAIMDSLSGIKASMARTGRGRPMTATGAIKKAVEAIPKQYGSLFTYDVVKKGGKKVFKYRLNKTAEKDFYANAGKLVVFTDRMDWTAEEVVKTYNRKVFIEDDFHWLKDKLLIPMTPIWHRKDAHIITHVFMCVMGLLFIRYISYKLRDLGISDEQLFRELEGIRVGLVTRDGLNDPQIVVEDMTPIQARIFSKLDLGRYLKLNNF